MFLILHYFNIAREDPLTTCMVHLTDLDIFLLLIHFYPNLTASDWKGRRQKKDLHCIFLWRYWSKSCSSSNGVFMFLLRPDSSFSRKSKTFWWKTFQRADEDTLDALAKLGKELISTFTLNLHKTLFFSARCRHANSRNNRKPGDGLLLPMVKLNAELHSQPSPSLGAICTQNLKVTCHQQL